MSRTVRKVKKTNCKWCGHPKRHRYPERAECVSCQPKSKKGKPSA